MQLLSKYILYFAVILILIGIYIPHAPNKWISTNGIISKVSNQHDVVNTKHGLTEVETHTEVVYSVDKQLYTTNINVIRAQPVQVGNALRIEYDEYDIIRQNWKIPTSKQFIFYGISLLLIVLYLRHKFNSTP